jgi:hypothetical protein
MYLRQLAGAAALAAVWVSALSGQAPATPAAERQAAWAAHQQLAASSPFAPLPWRALGPSHQAERIDIEA